MQGVHPNFVVQGKKNSRGTKFVMMVSHLNS